MPLSAANVSYAYQHDRPVLQGVSASFPPAALSVLLGPNGSGKSTLLRLLLGALRPSSAAGHSPGAVRLDGRDTAAFRGRERAARFAFIPQRPALWAPFTVREYVALGRHALPANPAAVTGALTRLELADRADDPFAALSAGQQQRAALARVLAQVTGPTRAPGPAAGAPCILADEPVSAMDPRHGLQAMGVLAELARLGATVIVVLHDFTLAARFASHATLLDDQGRVAASGPARQVLTPDVLSGVFATPFLRLGADDAPVLVPAQLSSPAA